jgi:hypothetical protein
MNGRIDAERILDAFLAPEADQLPDRVIDAALADIARTPQRRALRVPWRFPYMPALSRATSLVAAVLVVAVGVGVFAYLNSPGGSGQSTPAPTSSPTTEPTTAPTAASTPQPTFDPTDLSTYTSAVYGHTISYPSSWSVEAEATEACQPPDRVIEASCQDIFLNDPAIDGDQIAMFVFQVPAPEGADLASWEGLEALAMDNCGEPPAIACPSGPATPMCIGQQDCQPAIIVLVSDEQTPSAYFADSETGAVTVYAMGREDDFPAATRYGGTIALLKAILAQVDVREPRPGETPH